MKQNQIEQSLRRAAEHAAPEYSDRLGEAAERLHAGGESGFKIDLTTDRLPDADALELLFTRVRFEDGSPDWRSGEGPFAVLEPLPAIDAETLALLRAEAGPDAVCFS